MDHNCTEPVLGFDGDCNLCNSAIQFLIGIDRKKRMRFTSLASPWAQHRLGESVAPDSVVLFRGTSLFVKSDAVLEVFQILGSGWRILLVLKYLPKRFRDAIYDLVARNRMRLFGRASSTCWVKTDALAERFI